MAKSNKNENDFTEFDDQEQPKKGKAGQAAKVVHFEEWRMERVAVGDDSRLEKLKKVRENVKITDEEADTLNSKALSPGAINPIMYLKPGEQSSFDIPKPEKSR